MIKIDKRIGIILAILIVLIVAYKIKDIVMNRRKSSRKGGKGGKSSKGGKGSKGSKKSKSSKSSKSSNKKSDSGNSSNENLAQKNNEKPASKRENDDSSDSSESDSEDVDIKQDAKVLYNAIHSDMSRGMTAEEFNRRTSDIDSVDGIFYIELKQLYNEATEAGRNPETSVKLSDYINLLSKN